MLYEVPSPPPGQEDLNASHHDTSTFDPPLVGAPRSAGASKLDPTTAVQGQGPKRLAPKPGLFAAACQRTRTECAGASQLDSAAPARSPRSSLSQASSGLLQPRPDPRV